MSTLIAELTQAREREMRVRRERVLVSLAGHIEARKLAVRREHSAPPGERECVSGLTVSGSGRTELVVAKPCRDGNFSIESSNELMFGFSTDLAGVAQGIQTHVNH